MNLINKIIIYIFLTALVFYPPVLYGKEAGFPVEITDGAGRRVVIKKTPERIISLSPGTTELLFYLGLSEKVVAVTTSCNYPPQALFKDKIGDINPNIEILMSYDPDLIVAERGLSDELVYQCDALGLPIVFLNSKDMRGIFSSITVLGKATGETEIAEELKVSLEGEIEKLKEKISEENERPRVFVEIWCEPLMTVGGKSFINELVELAGGVNIAGELDNNNVTITGEWVLEKDPEVIIVTTPGYKKKVLERPGWQDISAVKESRVYEIDPDIFVRPTPRVIIGIRKISSWFYPDLDIVSSD